MHMKDLDFGNQLVRILLYSITEQISEYKLSLLFIVHQLSILEICQNMLFSYRHDHDELVDKLSAIEKKVIVGGVDLLKKSEEQEKLLEESAKELEERVKKQEALRKELEEKEAERIDIEEKYANLQEEAVGKTKKLKKVWSMLMSAKSEVSRTY